MDSGVQFGHSQRGGRWAGDVSDTTTLAPLRRQVRPLLEAVVPTAGGIDDARLDAVTARIVGRLAHEPASLRRQLRLLVRVLQWLPLLFSGWTLAGLDAPGRVRFLERLQDAPVAKLRVGVWGLRTLLFLGWYGDENIATGLGWHASTRGWAG
jgi:hypothetical protein